MLRPQPPTSATVSFIAACAFLCGCSDDAVDPKDGKTAVVDGAAADALDADATGHDSATGETSGASDVEADIAANDAGDDDIAASDVGGVDAAADGELADATPTTDATDSDAAGTTDGEATADIAEAATCTSSQWASCDDGNSCTKDFCHVNGCHVFDKSDCDSCPLYSRNHIASSGQVRLYDAVMSGDLQIAVGQSGPGSTADPPFFVAREAAGDLKWTLKYSTSNYTKLWAMSARNDNFLWLVGDREGVSTTDGIIVRLRKDGKASYEWTVKQDKHLTHLRGVANTSGNGLIAAGYRLTAQQVPSGLVIWRNSEGGLAGPQEVLTGSNRRLFDIESAANETSGNWAVGNNEADKGGLVLHITANGKLIESLIKAKQKTITLRRVANLSADSIAAIGAVDNHGLLIVGGAAGFVQYTPKTTAVGLFDEVTATGDGDVVVTGHVGMDPKWGSAFVARLSTKTGKVVWQQKLSGAPAYFSGVQRFSTGGYALAGTLHGSGGWMLRVNSAGSLNCAP